MLVGGNEIVDVILSLACPWIGKEFFFITNATSLGNVLNLDFKSVIMNKQKKIVKLGLRKWSILAKV